MRKATIVIATLAICAGAAQAQDAARPGWLASHPDAPRTKTWTPPGQWPMCIAGLTPPGEGSVRAAALANYRALYFQKAVGQDGLTIAEAKAALEAAPKPPGMIVAACVDEAPSAADPGFRKAFPWATSYFDATLDREMFKPVPMTD